MPTNLAGIPRDAYECGFFREEVISPGGAHVALENISCMLTIIADDRVIRTVITTGMTGTHALLLGVDRGGHMSGTR